MIIPVYYGDQMVLHAFATSGSAGSIGPAGIKRANSGRIKGFHATPLTERIHVNSLIDAVHAAQATSPDTTRTTVRALMERRLRRGIGGRIDGLAVEGIFPLTHIPDLCQFDLIYLGGNKKARRPAPEVFSQIIHANADAGSIPQAEPQDLLSSVSSRGYIIERITATSTSADDIAALVRLYTEAFTRYIFPITPPVVQDMLSNEQNIFLVARARDGSIASAMIAEHGLFPIDVGVTMHLFELSDFATFKSHQGQGLMSALQVTGINMILDQYGPTNVLIYAEDRGAYPSVVASSAKAGLVPVGALPLHVTIGSDNTSFDERCPPFETLIPVVYNPRLHRATAIQEMVALHASSP